MEACACIYYDHGRCFLIYFVRGEGGEGDGRGEGMEGEMEGRGRGEEMRGEERRGEEGMEGERRWER